MIGILLVLVGEVSPDPPRLGQIILTVFTQFGHGLQAVYEEKFITKYNLAPLKVVGLEGELGEETPVQTELNINQELTGS